MADINNVYSELQSVHNTIRNIDRAVNGTPSGTTPSGTTPSGGTTGGGLGVSLQTVASKFREVSHALTQFMSDFSDIKRREGELEKLDIEREKIKQVYEKDIMLERLKTENEINLRRAQYLKEQSLAFTKAAVNSITSGINEGAYHAYERQIEFQKATAIFQIENIKSTMTLQKNLQQKAVQNYVDLQTNANKREIAEREKNITYAKTAFNTISNVAGIFGETGRAIGGIVSSIGSFATGGMEMSKAFEQISNMLQEAGFERDTAVLAKMFEMYGAQISQVADMEKVLVEYQSEYAKTVLDLTKSTEKWIDTTEKGVTQYSRMFGYLGSQFETFRSRNVNRGGLADWAAQVGLKTEDIAKMVSGYQGTTGRLGLLSEKDVMSIGLLDTYVGEDGYAMRLAANLQDFNKSIADSASISMKHMNSVAKQGLSLSKYAKDVEKSLHLANKYNFKGGTEGLMRMAEYVQRTKGSMDELGGILDKFRTGNISNILESTARLNVLGGAAALYSDPLGMLYDAYMDPESMYKRVQAMTSGFGTFNKETGELDFGIDQQMTMQMISEVTGMSYESMRKQLTDRDRRRQIAALLSGSGFTEDMITNIASNATYNTRTGKWEAMTASGVKKNVGEISDKEAVELIPKDTEENIMGITSDTKSMRDSLMTLKSIEERRALVEGIGQYKFVSRLYEFYKENSEDRLAVYGENIDKGLNRFEDKIKGQMNKILKSYGILFDDEKVLSQAFQDMIKGDDGIEGVNEKLESIMNDVNRIADKYVGKTDTYEIEKEYGHFFNKEAVQKIEDAYVDEIAKYKELPDSPEKRFYMSEAYRNRDIRLRKLYNTEHQNTNDEIVSISDRIEQKGGWLHKMIAAIVRTSQHGVNLHDGITYGSAYIPSANAFTSPSDANVSMEKGGPIHTLFTGVAANVNSIGSYIARSEGLTYGGSSRSMNVNVNLAGRAEVDCNGSSSGNIVDMLTSDPFAIRKISELVLSEISRYNDGRGTVNAYTNVGNIFNA